MEKGIDYSQAGESKVLAEIFKVIEPTNKFCVEFGGGNGYSLSNTRYFIDTEGWTGLLMDISPGDSRVIKETITPENINEVLQKHNCPEIIDLISIDIDGNDHFVFENLTHNCSVVIIEYNSHYGINEDVYMERNDNMWNDGQTSYSASFKHMRTIGENKGYFLYKEVGLNNMIFIKNEFKDKFPAFDENSVSLPNQWGFPKNEIRKMIYK